MQPSRGGRFLALTSLLNIISCVLLSIERHGHHGSVIAVLAVAGISSGALAVVLYVFGTRHRRGTR